MSQLQQKIEKIEPFREEVDQVKADCHRWKEGMDRFAAEKETALAQLSSAEVQLRNAREKSSIQAKRIDELEAELAKAQADAEKEKVQADKSVAIYLADAEAAQAWLREATDRAQWFVELAKCQTRRETLEKIHARGFNLSQEIGQAKMHEADARLLASSGDNDNDEGRKSGSHNGEGPEEEASPNEGITPEHSQDSCTFSILLCKTIIGPL